MQNWIFCLLIKSFIPENFLTIKKTPYEKRDSSFRTPAGQMHTGQTPAGQMHAGQTPAGQTPAGQANNH